MDVEINVSAYSYHRCANKVINSGRKSGAITAT
jgi:hypothetical protein